MCAGIVSLGELSPFEEAKYILSFTCRSRNSFPSSQFHFQFHHHDDTFRISEDFSSPGRSSTRNGVIRPILKYMCLVDPLGEKGQRMLDIFDCITALYGQQVSINKSDGGGQDTVPSRQ